MPESPSADALLDGTGQARARGAGRRGGAIWQGSSVAGPGDDGDDNRTDPGDIHA
ncbi:hypothetical protein [Streptomyces sp. NPDC002855]|uniref:hypothetical protein n=1 Tax=unclassified Streptomyces TaxID=2593676 RepID=UPI003321B073